MMITTLKNWLSKTLTHELRLAIQWQQKNVRHDEGRRPATTGVAVQNNSHKSHTAHNRTNKKYTDNGSALIISEISQVRYVQLVKFLSREAPFECVLSDGHTLIKAKIPRAAANAYSTQHHKLISDNPEGSLLQLRGLDIVVSKGMTDEEQLTLLIKDFVFEDVSNIVTNTEPIPVQGIPGISALLAELEGLMDFGNDASLGTKATVYQSDSFISRNATVAIPEEHKRSPGSSLLESGSQLASQAISSRHAVQQPDLVVLGGANLKPPDRFGRNTATSDEPESDSRNKDSLLGLLQKQSHTAGESKVGRLVSTVYPTKTASAFEAPVIYTPHVNSTNVIRHETPTQPIQATAYPLINPSAVNNIDFPIPQERSASKSRSRDSHIGGDTNAYFNNSPRSTYTPDTEGQVQVHTSLTIVSDGQESSVRLLRKHGAGKKLLSDPRSADEHVAEATKDAPVFDSVFVHDKNFRFVRNLASSERNPVDQLKLLKRQDSWQYPAPDSRLPTPNIPINMLKSLLGNTTVGHGSSDHTTSSSLQSEIAVANKEDRLCKTFKGNTSSAEASSVTSSQVMPYSWEDTPPPRRRTTALGSTLPPHSSAINLLTNVDNVTSRKESPGLAVPAASIAVQFASTADNLHHSVSLMQGSRDSSSNARMYQSPEKSGQLARNASTVFGLIDESPPSSDSSDIEMANARPLPPQSVANVPFDVVVHVQKATSPETVRQTDSNLTPINPHDKFSSIDPRSELQSIRNTTPKTPDPVIAQTVGSSNSKAAYPRQALAPQSAVYSAHRHRTARSDVQDETAQPVPYPEAITDPPPQLSVDNYGSAKDVSLPQKRKMDSETSAQSPNLPKLRHLEHKSEHSSSQVATQDPAEAAATARRDFFRRNNQCNVPPTGDDIPPPGSDEFEKQGSSAPHTDHRYAARPTGLEVHGRHLNSGSNRTQQTQSPNSSLLSPRRCPPTHPSRVGTVFSSGNTIHTRHAIPPPVKSATWILTPPPGPLPRTPSEMIPQPLRSYDRSPGQAIPVNIKAMATKTPTIPSLSTLVEPSQTKYTGSSPKFSISIFETFQKAYPSYSGNIKHFQSLCRKIASELVLHKSLWDDYVIRHRLDYSSYIARRAEEGEDAVTFEQFYRDEIDSPQYCLRILNPTTLKEALDSSETTIASGPMTPEEVTRVSSSLVESTLDRPVEYAPNANDNEFKDFSTSSIPQRSYQPFAAVSTWRSPPVHNHGMRNSYRPTYTASPEYGGSHASQHPRGLHLGRYQTDPSKQETTSSKPSGLPGTVAYHSAKDAKDTPILAGTGQKIREPGEWLNFESDLDPMPSNEALRTQPWWNDEETPFRMFTRNYVNLKIHGRILTGPGGYSKFREVSVPLDVLDWQI